MNEVIEKAESKELEEARVFVIRTQKPTISSLQRFLRIGYNKAARLMEKLEAEEVVSAFKIDGTRDVLMKAKTKEEVEELKRQWLDDPCWDIEGTEGFEAHKEELKKFSAEKELDWDKIRRRRDDIHRASAERMGLSGLLNQIQALERRVSDLENQQ